MNEELNRCQTTVGTVGDRRAHSVDQSETQRVLWVTWTVKCVQYVLTVTMRLRQPTDFLILEALSDGRRDTGANIAALTETDRGYVNTELRHLADHGLVRKVGPHDNSGLYQITPLGVAAVEKRDLYNTDQDRFETLIYDLADDITLHPASVTVPP